MASARENSQSVDNNPVGDRVSIFQIRRYLSRSVYRLSRSTRPPNTHVRLSTVKHGTRFQMRASISTLFLCTLYTCTQISMAIPEGGQWTTNISYATENYLQDYDAFIPSKSPCAKEPSVWVIYIHGGFFRDPLVLADSFKATVEVLESSKDRPSSPQVAGYATLNYRLSAHPNYPQPPDTPNFELRNASWPQHLDDVCTGIKELQSTYGFGSNYILAGHSVGAQLALLASLEAAERGFTAPKLVLGLSGIYDFPLIHRDHPEYRVMTFGAMQEGEEVAASPVRYAAKDYERAGVKHVVIGHSKDDGLVGWNQVEAMVDVLEKSSRGRDYVSVLELYGAHNDIWGDGKQSSRAILAALDCVGATL